MEAKIEKSRLDAEKARLDAEKARLEAENARLEASLGKLAIEREAAAAIAEAEALEAIVYPDNERHSRAPDLEIEGQDPLQRTSEYVQQHSKQNTDSLSAQEPGQHATREPDQQRYTTQEVSSKSQVHQRGNAEQNDPAYGTHISWVPKPTGNPTTTSSDMLRRYVTSQPKEEPPDRYDYTTPSHYNTHPPTYHGANQATMDFAKFFARRELITKGLVKFNDRPEGFRAWRSSFQNTIRDLDLSYSEEIDLLIKYLGTESAEHAKRIRVININHPETGLKMIWHRLNECYGSAEVVENALFKRIDDFPKISNKGYQKLRELSDLLMELQVAKAEGDLPGLAFLDTARGVNSIVQKLPYNLQERWMAHGSKFKQTYNVTFPPFTVFVDFVYQQAKMRNDPSFELTLPHATPSVPNTRKAVTVHKTNVFSSGSFHRSADSSQEETKTKDPGKQCPLHQRPHPLLKCRAFRGKSIDDRKAFLKENHICYKCCSSTSHLAKDCKERAIPALRMMIIWVARDPKMTISFPFP
ncbi:hypothetical protein XENTR_v10000047 [Xenopus tropicalis]|nr:hypothetical protein XENTR_v10000047 [Xenopus tropicalis]